MPLQFTSKQTAEAMALAAYNRALKLSGPGLWAYLTLQCLIILHIECVCRIAHLHLNSFNLAVNFEVIERENV